MWFKSIVVHELTLNVKVWPRSDRVIPKQKKGLHCCNPPLTMDLGV